LASDDWRSRSPTRYLSAEGDFDGDGIADFAMLERRGSGLAAWAVLSGAAKDCPREYLLAEWPMVSLPRLGLDIVKPQLVEIACEVSPACNSNVSLFVKTRFASIVVFFEESSVTQYSFNPDKCEFNAFRTSG
jgi:hypothetical protein